jgi:SAM-dependent MidA family methyltransferase
LTTSATFVPWDVAWQRALYGQNGFYRRPGGAPAAHFRTSVHASGLLAGALARLVRAAGLSRVVDVGSGRGELLTALSDVDPGLALVGVDVVGRPEALDGRVEWMTVAGGGTSDLPDDTLQDALVVAHEWLDDVPCPVVAVDSVGRWLQVEVDPTTGRERLGEAATVEQEQWLARWWPAGGPASRAEVGLSRDRAWARLMRSAARSILLAVDYSHARAQRPPHGSLAAYRAGRLVPPVADGTCDLTAHVALDAVAVAGEAAGAGWTVLTSQQAALNALGVSADRPGPEHAGNDVAGYLRRLTTAGEAAELLDPGGLGSFGWLLQSRGPAVPDAWAGFDSTPPGSRR